MPRNRRKRPHRRRPATCLPRRGGRSTAPDFTSAGHPGGPYDADGRLESTPRPYYADRTRGGCNTRRRRRQRGKKRKFSVFIAILIITQLKYPVCSMPKPADSRPYPPPHPPDMFPIHGERTKQQSTRLERKLIPCQGGRCCRNAGFGVKGGIYWHHNSK